MGKTGYGLFSVYAVVYSYTILMESGLTKNLVRLLASNEAIDVRIKHLRTAIGLYGIISFFLLLTLPMVTLLFRKSYSRSQKRTRKRRVGLLGLRLSNI